MSRPLTAGRDYPSSTGDTRSWFSTDADCLDYLEWLHWPDGFVCADCGHRGRWRLGDGRFRCAGCGAASSVTAGTTFDRTHTVDRVVLGDLAVRHPGGRRVGTEPATGARHRLLPDGVGDAAPAARGRGGSVTDGWQGYHGIAGLGYTHARLSRRATRARGGDAYSLLPGVHRTASLAKRWLLGKHPGSSTPPTCRATSTSSSPASTAGPPAAAAWCSGASSSWRWPTSRSATGSSRSIPSPRSARRLAGGGVAPAESRAPPAHRPMAVLTCEGTVKSIPPLPIIRLAFCSVVLGCPRSGNDDGVRYWPQQRPRGRRGAARSRQYERVTPAHVAE